MWFSSRPRHRTVSRKQRPVNRFRRGVEVLEERAVPATLTVNTTLDVLRHDNGMLSLRQAIIDANATPQTDTIILPAGTYTLTRPGINEAAGLTGDLDCSGALTIQGAGAGTTTVDAAGLDRVFHVLTGANVTLSGLTIKAGVESNALLPICARSGNSTKRVTNPDTGSLRAGTMRAGPLDLSAQAEFASVRRADTPTPLRDCLWHKGGQFGCQADSLSPR
jgi:hypothetical protein